MEDEKRRPLGWAGLGRAGLDLSGWDVWWGEEKKKDEKKLGRILVEDLVQR